MKGFDPLILGLALQSVKPPKDFDELETEHAQTRERSRESLLRLAQATERLRRSREEVGGSLNKLAEFIERPMPRRNKWKRLR